MYNEKVVSEIEGCISNLEQLGDIYSSLRKDKTPINVLVESLNGVKDKYTEGVMTSIEAIVLIEFVTDVTSRLIADVQTVAKVKRTLQ